MKVYWDLEDRSFIIENNNGKRMRVTSSMVETNPTSDHISMDETILVHEVDPLDMVGIGDKVNPAEVAREGVALRLIGTNCYIVYCENQWRMMNGNSLGFIVNEAVLHAKKDYGFLTIVRDRLNKF